MYIKKAYRYRKWILIFSLRVVVPERNKGVAQTRGASIHKNAKKVQGLGGLLHGTVVGGMPAALKKKASANEPMVGICRWCVQRAAWW